MSTNDSTQVFTADVLHVETKIWSNVVGTGGGYYSLPISIRTYHQRMTEMWVSLSDGREMRIDFAGDFPVLPGHRIACLTHSTQIWAARNFNTGTIQWLVTAESLTGSFKFFWHWIILGGILPAVICAFILNEFRNPSPAPTPGILVPVSTTVTPYVVQCIGVLAVIAVGIDTIRYIMHRKRRANNQSLINTGHAKLLEASSVPPAQPPLSTR